MLPDDAPPGLIKELMQQARQRLYAATGEMDAIWRRRRDMTKEELIAALKPYANAATALPDKNTADE